MLQLYCTNRQHWLAVLGVVFISVLLVARASNIQASVAFTIYEALKSRTTKDALSFVEVNTYIVYRHWLTFSASQRIAYNATLAWGAPVLQTEHNLKTFTNSPLPLPRYLALSRWALRATAGVRYCVGRHWEDSRCAGARTGECWSRPQQGWEGDRSSGGNNLAYWSYWFYWFYWCTAEYTSTLQQTGLTLDKHRCRYCDVMIVRYGGVL